MILAGQARHTHVCRRIYVNLRIARQAAWRPRAGLHRYNAYRQTSAAPMVIRMPPAISIRDTVSRNSWRETA